jgi:hypothetical protein
MLTITIYYTIGEVAGMWGVSTLIKDRLLHLVKIGKGV